MADIETEHASALLRLYEIKSRIKSIILVECIENQKIQTKFSRCKIIKNNN